MQCSHSIRIVSWQDEALILRSIRTAVFIHEQQVPADLEWDEFDAISMHVLALNSDGQPIGTARLLPDGHIGRMAVLKEWRGKGVGSAMMRRILEEINHRGIPIARLNAQTTAIRFYEKFGFQMSGKEFMEAGIPHVKMIFNYS
ncbi:GNAT family N-acetyltransferase [Nitrosomonas sp. Nm166]|uniref:GNAT family N-acetyltransferase n=1 Tax=Nitrosomonas sp. Nm166 TaxID=1881054 RepID=UPI0008F05C5C|nr:GNAT family N-acetyltransferase [Nitrosomonas sp. Nm166]SFE20638.1 Predicted N-acyltransferase, GNAT family [Nitrosomonas sp. Nm166]